MKKFGATILCMTAAIGLASCDNQAPPSESATDNTAAQSYTVQKIVPGSPFHGIHGLTFDANDQILVGSVVGQSIHQVDPETGAVSTYIGPPNGMADDLEFGPDGTLVWTGFILGKLFAQSPGGPVREIASDLPGLNSTAFSPDGRLFATQVFAGDALYEFDITGQIPPRKIIEGMGGLNGFDFGADGKLYGPLWFKGQVVRVDVDTGVLEVITEGIQVPAAVNFDSQGNLHVIDNETGEIFRIDIETGERTLIATAPTNLDNLAFDSHDRLYVTNMSDNAIYEIDTQTGATRTVISGSLSSTAGIAFASSVNGDRLYVADTFSLSYVDPQTHEVHDISRIISDHEYPTDIDATEDQIVTSSTTAGLVQVWSVETGEMTRRWHDFVLPLGVEFLDDGRVVVVEAGTGKILAVSGEHGETRDVLYEGLVVPVGVTKIADTLYFTESETGIVHSLGLIDGAHAVIAEGLDLPEGIDATLDGSLVVAEVGANRAIRIDPNSGEVVVMTENIPLGYPGFAGLPRAFLPNGIAAGAGGEIYVASDIENAIYRLTPN